MRCEQARQLFDAYLDGDLSPALATELGAHRVRCPDCRRALALLEVSGQIIASDHDEASLKEDFSSRLLACMEAPRRHWHERIRYALYYAGPLAAAAVIALAFLGVFDRSNGTKVQGVKVDNLAAPVARAVPEPASDDSIPTGATSEERALELWIDQARKSNEARRQSVESLQQHFDLTIGQWLDILEQANDTSSSEDHFPGADTAGEPTEDAPDPTESVESVD